MQEVLDLINKQKREVDLDSNVLSRIHHILMKEYGWIPYEEFKQLPIYVASDLLNEISKDKELEEKEIDKAKRKKKW